MSIRNRVLTVMSVSERSRIAPHLEHISAAAGQVLFRRGDVVRYVYFPLDTILSLHRTGDDGVTQGAVHVGNEGFVDSSLIMGGRSSTGMAMVQVSGTFMRLKVHILRREMSHSVALERLLLKCLQLQLFRGSQDAICRRFHDDVQRTSTSILRSVERLGEGNMGLTIGLLSTLLPLEPDMVGAALRKLQTVGAIMARGGRVVIVDRTCLLSLACRCYCLENIELQRLLPLCAGGAVDVAVLHPQAEAAFGGS